MNRQQLVDAVADAADLPKVAAGKAVDAVFVVITNALRFGDNVRLSGFGIFEAKVSNARYGHNPLTGEPMYIPAAKKAKLKPAKALRDVLNDIDA